MNLRDGEDVPEPSMSDFVIYVVSGLFSSSAIGLFPRRSTLPKKHPSPCFTYDTEFCDKSRKKLLAKQRERAVKRLEKEKHMMLTLAFRHEETQQEKRHSSLGFFMIVFGRLPKLLARREGAVRH